MDEQDTATNSEERTVESMISILGQNHAHTLIANQTLESMKVYFSRN
jgi:hypothetical protein